MASFYRSFCLIGESKGNGAGSGVRFPGPFAILDPGLEAIMNLLKAVSGANGGEAVRRLGSHFGLEASPGRVFFALCLSLLLSPALAQTRVKPGFNLFSAEQDVEIGK